MWPDVCAETEPVRAACTPELHPDAGSCRGKSWMIREMALFPIWPVSYTHLDVYKRQALLADVDIAGAGKKSDGGHHCLCASVGKMCRRYRLYDYHGIYQHGFFNSVLGQKDCLVTTNGYNYIALDDDV